LVGRWLKPVALVAKQLAARLVFLSTLIILLPLAVLNRQTVTIAFNPMDLLRDAPQGRLAMPLFIALFALFILGLIAGWVMGRLGQNRGPSVPRPTSSQAASQPLSEATSASPMPPRPVVINKAPEPTEPPEPDTGDKDDTEAER
jgi:formate hydrogenlyase subunit 3/multisubunit Na+/H+ antiporter MnhD subunit